MKQLIAMLAAETMLLCTACGQNEAAFETKDPQTLRAAVTVPAAESCGTKYTLAQLMDYALRYSDNTAYYMLVTKLGQRASIRRSGTGAIRISAFPFPRGFRR
ncbi:MAG: serine hydrolase [Oscillospiraceae bacterium]|nr:serine hydrolase [Oscillospiraceae bacterium]